MHLFPGFSGILVGLVAWVSCWAAIHFKAAKFEAFTFDAQGREHAFEPRLANYIRAGEFIISLATGSIVLLVGSSALHSGGRLPWFYASPLILLSLCVIYGVLFMVLLVISYENFSHEPDSYKRHRYVGNQALGFSSLICFCAGYVWLVVAITQ
jgi:hypothetical protein